VRGSPTKIDRENTPARRGRGLTSSVLTGGGQAGALMRLHDWTSTPLGSPETWPEALKTLVAVMLGSSQAMFLAWGRDRCLLYNDAYAEILASKHPAALGQDFLKVWQEIRGDLVPIVDKAYRGDPVQMDDIELWVDRKGFREEAHFTFSYTPVRGDSGDVDGFFCVCQEITAQIVAERSLRESEARAQADAERVRLALDAGAIIGTWFYDIPADRFAVDEQFANAFGIDPELGRSGLGLEEMIATVHPDDKSALVTAVEEAIARGGPYAHQYRVRRMDGRYYWIEANGRVDKASDGTPLSFPGVLLDIEERRRTETALQETSRKLDAILNNTREAVFLMDHQQHCVYANAAAEALTGYRAEDLHGRPLHELIHHKKPDGSPYPIEECPIDRAFPARAQMSGEELFVAPDGSFYPVGFTASPLLDEEGSPVGTVIEARNIAEEKARDEALHEQKRILETLNRTGAAVAAELDLERVVQTVTDAGVELTGAQFGAFFYNVLNEAGEAFMLYTLSGADRSQFERFGTPRATAVFKPTFDGKGIIRSDDILADPRYGKNAPHWGMPKGHLPVRSYLAVPVASRSGEIIGGLFFGHPEPGRFNERHETLMLGVAAQAAIAIDNARLYRDAQLEIDQRRKAEKQQQLLINELNHRVKNTLAIVQGLAQQSFKGDVSADVARAAFNARLSALAAAHNLLTSAGWERASLFEIISSSVRATAGAASSQVTCGGPQMVLSPQTAVSLAMAIHELSTNAIKYGALSHDAGTVSVVWRVTRGEDGPRLHLEWIELGGPPVAVPTKKGFGTRMIERGLAAELRGEVVLEFASSGVRCVIDAPLPEA
jgi:PAS domain S-box-containing protein